MSGFFGGGAAADRTRCDAGERDSSSCGAGGAPRLNPRCLLALHRHLIVDERLLPGLLHDGVAVGAGLLGLIVGDRG